MLHTSALTFEVVDQASRFRYLHPESPSLALRIDNAQISAQIQAQINFSQMLALKFEVIWPLHGQLPEPRKQLYSGEPAVHQLTPRMLRVVRFL